MKICHWLLKEDVDFISRHTVCTRLFGICTRFRLWSSRWRIKVWRGKSYLIWRLVIFMQPTCFLHKVNHLEVSLVPSGVNSDGSIVHPPVIRHAYSVIFYQFSITMSAIFLPCCCASGASKCNKPRQVRTQARLSKWTVQPLYPQGWHSYLLSDEQLMIQLYQISLDIPALRSWRSRDTWMLEEERHLRLNETTLWTLSKCLSQSCP